MANGEVRVSSKDGSDICRNAGGSLFQRGGTATAMERLENLSDEVTEGGVVLEWMRIGLRWLQAFSFENTRRAKNGPCRIK